LPPQAAAAASQAPLPTPAQQKTAGRPELLGRLKLYWRVPEWELLEAVQLDLRTVLPPLLLALQALLLLLPILLLVLLIVPLLAANVLIEHPDHVRQPLLSTTHAA
jgi:hypothetical protein